MTSQTIHSLRFNELTIQTANVSLQKIQSPPCYVILGWSAPIKL